MNENASFYSHGKLLLTGEYLVLDGALAFAIPLKVGQKTTIIATENKNQIQWQASDLNGTWFTCNIDIPTWSVIKTTQINIAETLIKYLQAVQHLNPLFLEKTGQGFNVENYCSFNVQWGLGSSSTFISNLAWWANINPFDLQASINTGSGYDIACARSNTPILYKLKKTLPSIHPVTFKPNFLHQLYFVYSGQKQSTMKEINDYKTQGKIKAIELDTISTLSHELSKTSHINDLKKIIKEHEQVVSKILKRPTIKSERFNDFEGEIKSLGAWGGDFILAVSDRDEKETNNFFKNKGYDTIYKYNELALQ